MQKGVKASVVACTQFTISRFGPIGAYNEGYIVASEAAEEVHSSQS